MSQARESKAAQMKRRAANVKESVGADIVHPPAPETPSPRLAFGTTDSIRGMKRSKDAASIEIERIIEDPEQPRKEFDQADLEHLAESLKRHGQLQPIRVRWDADSNAFRIIMGARRWMASQLAGRPRIDAIIHDGPLSDEQIKDLQLVENCLRSDLTPMERARAFKSRIDRTGCSVRQLATELAMSHTSINRALALIGLPPEVQTAIEEGRISPAAGEEIAKLPAEEQVTAATEAEGKSRQQLRAERGVPSAVAPPVERGVPPTGGSGALGALWSQVIEAQGRAEILGITERQAIQDAITAESSKRKPDAARIGSMREFLRLDDRLRHENPTILHGPTRGVERGVPPGIEPQTSPPPSPEQAEGVERGVPVEDGPELLTSRQRLALADELAGLSGKARNPERAAEIEATLAADDAARGIPPLRPGDVELIEGQGGKARPAGAPKVPGTPIGAKKIPPHVFTVRVPQDGHAMEFRCGFARVIVVMNPDTEDAEKEALQRALWMLNHGKGELIAGDVGEDA